MILLDTNVVSEMMKPPADRDVNVSGWLRNQPIRRLYISTPSIGEIRSGLAMMGIGRRRADLEAAVRTMIERLFQGRVLVFDLAAAHMYGEIIAFGRRNGRAVSPIDGQIGAIAHAHGMSVASRDTSGFVGELISVVNPWADTP